MPNCSKKLLALFSGILGSNASWSCRWYQRLGGACYLHLQDALALKMEMHATRFSKTFATT